MKNSELAYIVKRIEYCNTITSLLKEITKKLKSLGYVINKVTASDETINFRVIDLDHVNTPMQEFTKLAKLFNERAIEVEKDTFVIDVIDRHFAMVIEKDDRNFIAGNSWNMKVVA